MIDRASARYLAWTHVVLVLADGRTTHALTMLITVLPNAGSLTLAAYSSRNMVTVLHVLIYCANNTALITGIVVGGFLYQRSKPLM
jgi:hypothetical protein